MCTSILGCCCLLCPELVHNALAILQPRLVGDPHICLEHFSFTFVNFNAEITNWHILQLGYASVFYSDLLRTTGGTKEVPGKSVTGIKLVHTRTNGTDENR